MRGRRPRRVADFRPVERVPEASEILTTNDHWAEPAGGGAVAAAEPPGSVPRRRSSPRGGRGRAGPAGRGGAAGAGFGRGRGSGCAPAAGAHLPGLPGRAHDHRARGEAAPARGDRPREELDATDGVYFTAGDEAAPARPAEPASWSRPRGSFRLFAPRGSARRARPQRVIRPSGTSRASSTRRRGSSFSTEGSDGGRYVADGK